MTQTISVDVAIIGAGTAGISAFKEASKITNKVILIDQGPLGTTCARVGCMPSKILIETANEFHSRLHFRQLGIRGAKQLRIDIPAVMRHIRKLRDYFTSGTIKYLESLGDQFIHAQAEFCEPNVLKVNQQTIIAKKIIIATGSSSIIPASWQPFSDQLLTTENIFEQKDFKKKIAIIGGGPIGIELGQALSRLGIKIEIYNSNEYIGKLTDPAINKYAIKLFQNEFSLHLNREAVIEKNKKSFTIKTGRESFNADQVIAALGRKSNLSSLGLEKIGVKLNTSGLPAYDHTTMQIKNFPIYIAGDSAGLRPLLHEAADDGHIAGYNAVQKEMHCFSRRTPLAIIFSQPNIAIVGKSYKDLQGQDFIIGEARFDDQGRARIMSQNQGILHVYATPTEGKLLGAEMIAPSGEHLAHLLAWAVQQNMTVFDALQMPFYHPVVEEGMRTALRMAGKQITQRKHQNFELTMCDSEAISNLS